MKNPCDDDCLVQPMCTEVCSEKTIYGQLIKETADRHHDRFMTKEGKNNPIYKEKYIHWKALSVNHQLQVIVINTRAHEMNKI